MKTTSALIILLVLALCFASSCAKTASGSYWPAEDWKALPAAKVGMDAKLLSKLNELQSELPEISSLLAVRHGYLVFEKYYAGDSKQLRSTYELTPSVLSSLVGIAIKQGRIQGPDQRMVDFFPENAIIARDPRVQQITLRHLLTMSDGIRASGNMIEYYFTDARYSRKLESDPGSKFQYNVVSPLIVSMILTTATGQSALDFAKANLFGPLGIKDVSWAEFKGKKGISHGAWGLMLTSRDLARFGYLYLRMGKWRNEQLVPESWIAASTVGQMATEEKLDYFKSYGYYWWIPSFKGTPAYSAIGWGGQLVCIVPKLDLVTVVTSRETKLQGEEHKYLDAIDKYIVASIKE